MKKKPRRILIEYEDGTKREVDCSALDERLQWQLAYLEEPTFALEDALAHAYVVLSWTDGWQEVIGLEDTSPDLLRYYVIRRIEDRGRLSIETSASWPDLFVIERMPDGLASVLVIANDDVQHHAFDEIQERYEGTFEAGGKREYLKYDKTKPPTRQRRVGEDAFASMLEVARGALSELGLDPQEALALGADDRVRVWAGMAEIMGLRAHRRQADVYGLVELLVRKTASQRP